MIAVIINGAVWTIIAITVIAKYTIDIVKIIVVIGIIIIVIGIIIIVIGIIIIVIIINVIIKNVIFKNVIIIIAINMWYNFYGPDRYSLYVRSRETLTIDVKKPRLGTFCFRNINCAEA